MHKTYYKSRRLGNAVLESIKLHIELRVDIEMLLGEIDISNIKILANENKK